MNRYLWKLKRLFGDRESYEIKNRFGKLGARIISIRQVCMEGINDPPIGGVVLVWSPLLKLWIPAIRKEDYSFWQIGMGMRPGIPLEVKLDYVKYYIEMPQEPDYEGQPDFGEC